MHMGDFEWELSKENVQPLLQGRSVNLLNKVLQEKRSKNFLRRMKQYFELKLSTLPNSYRKLRLYTRYLHWMEQTHPCLGRSVELENLLYRGIRDSTHLEGVGNDVDYVAMWIRLTDFCQQPGQLFDLLFRSGVGTMSADFYHHWVDLLERRGDHEMAAGVLAHSLRAGARPLLQLEDKVESFMTRHLSRLLTRHERTAQSGDPTFRLESEDAAATAQRKKLAALSLVSDTPDAGAGVGATGKLRAPVVRTGEAWHANQSGLKNSQQPSGLGCHSRGQSQVPTSFVPTVVDENAPSAAVGPAGVATAAEISRPDYLCALGQPSQWSKENCRKATPWVGEKLRVPPAAPSGQQSPAPTAAWEIYKEPSSDEVDPSQNGDLTNRTTTTTQSVGLHQSTCTVSTVGTGRVRRKGLEVVTSTASSSLSTSDAVSLQHQLRDIAAFSGLLAPDRADEYQLLPGPSLPELSPLGAGEQDAVPKDAVFGVPLELIYGGAEELTWELAHGAHWCSREHQGKKEKDSVGGQNSSSTSEVSPLLLLLGFNSRARGDTDGDNCDWSEEEQMLLTEINAIDCELSDLPRLLPADEQVTDASHRAALIQSLETVALGARCGGHSRG